MIIMQKSFEEISMKQTKTTVYIPPQSTPYFELSAHYVTWKRDQTPLKKSFLPSDLEAYLVLYELAQKAPKKARKDLEALKAMYPSSPELLNLLSYLYMRLKKIKLADKITKENFERNPDYLIARINYADLCLRMKKVDEIPKLFNSTFDLAKLYPHQKNFYISEFRGFMVLMGHYHCHLKDKEAAICYHYMASVVDPHHPNTRTLEKKLYPSSKFKKLKKFFKKNFITL